jgi:hypothetical protein
VPIWFLALLCIRSICFVAGGGFVPQSVIDSSELTDSTIVRNAKKGQKGNFFIQFSFSFSRFVIPKYTLLYNR